MAVTHPPLLDPEFLTRLERLSLRSRRRARGGLRGERRSATRGRGVEFADYRSYQVGDDYRYIDWNIYSRLDRLFVKLFSEEEDVNVHLLIDRSRSMGYGEPAKLDYAARVAAAIGYVGVTNLDRVGAAAFDRTIGLSLPPRRGRAQTFHLFHFLRTLAPGGSSDLAQVMREYLHQTHRRGLLILLSDLLMASGYETGLLLARYHGFEPFVIHIVSEEDLVPSVGGELRLVDSETGAAVEMTVDGPALALYARARDAYLGDLERFCLRHQIEYLRTTTAVPFEDLILRYLRAAGLLT